jgi:cell division protein FtsB
VLLVVVLAVLLVSYASSMKAWLQQRAHIQELEQQIRVDQGAVEQLAEEKRRWDDPAYIEAQARERFGMVLPGEVGYRVIGEDGKPLGVTSELSEPEGTTGGAPAWWDRAWGSVKEAGREPSELKKQVPPARYLGPGGARR